MIGGEKRPPSERPPSGRLAVDRRLLLILLLALLLRLVNVRFGLPDLLAADENFLVNHALGFGNGDLNPHFFNYPALQMYLLFAVYVVLYVAGRLMGAWGSGWDFAVAYFRDPTLLQTSGRLLTVLLGAATVWLVFRLAERWFGRAAALAAALVLAVSPLHVRHSQVIGTDVPMAFWAFLAVFLAARYLDKPAIKTLLAAGFVAGLAGAAKYPGLVAIAPVALAPFVAQTPAGAAPSGRSRHALAALAAALAGFAAGAPFTFLDWAGFRADMLFEMRHMKSGHLGMEGVPNGWGVHAVYSLPAIASHLCLLLAVVGIAAAVRSRPARALWLLLAPVAVYAVIGAQAVTFDRYALPLAPYVAVFAGLGVAGIARRGRGLRLAAALLLAAAVAPMLAACIRNSVSTCLRDTRTAARLSVNFALPEGESIALTNYGPQLPQTAESIQREQERVSERMQASGKAGGRQKSSAKFRLLDEAARGRKRYNVYFLDRMWRPGLAEDLVREGVTWAIIDYGMMGRYLRVPDKYPDPVAFYHSVRKKGRLVKTFAPEVHSFGPLSVSSPGPLIEVYRLRPPEAGKAAGARQHYGEHVQP